MESNISPDDQSLIDEWFSHINAHGGTHSLYALAITQYMKFHDMSLSELLEESEDDITNGVIPRKRRIKGRITDFRNSLEDKSDNTKHSYVSAIRSFYKSMDVELPSNKRYFKAAIMEENKNCGWNMRHRWN